MNKTILFIHSAGPQAGYQGSSCFIEYLKNELNTKYQFIHPIMPLGN